LNGEIQRRTDVVGICSNEAAIYRLVGALLLEQNDEWALQRRYMTLETLAEVGDNPKSVCPQSQPDAYSCQTGDDDSPTLSADASYTTPRGMIGAHRPSLHPLKHTCRFSSRSFNPISCDPMSGS